jgi:tetratricopeptide (TPR) repeat protein
MRSLMLGYTTAFSMVLPAVAVASDDVKAWERTTAIVTTRKPVMLQTAKGEQVTVIFPVVRTSGSVGDQVSVFTLAGDTGLVDKNKLVPLKDAIKLFGDRIKNDPNDADAYYRRALAREAKEDYQEALSDMDAAIRNNAAEADYYVARALIHFEMKKPAEAWDDAREALRIKPNSPPGHFVLGKILMGDFKFREAAEQFTDAIVAHPTFASALVQRAACRSSVGQERAALDDYFDALLINPKNDDVFLARGNFFYTRYGACREAIDDFAAAVKLNGHNKLALNNLAWIRATSRDDKVRDGAKALEMSKTACELDGWKQPMILGTYAAANAEIGRFEEAVKWQEKALALAHESQKGQFAATLELYRSRKPKRD